jgi:hypothetical protein
MFSTVVRAMLSSASTVKNAWWLATRTFGNVRSRVLGEKCAALQFVHRGSSGPSS